MRPTIRRRYLRWLLPPLAALLLLSLGLLWLTDFGVRFLFREPVPLSGLGSGELPGSYVSVPVEDLEHTFSFLGHRDREGAQVVDERYCFYPADGRYLIVRVPAEYVPLLAACDAYREQAALSDVPSELPKPEFGSLRGVVRTHATPEVQSILIGYISEKLVNTDTLIDRITGADASAYRENLADYAASVIYPLQLELGCWGRYPERTVLRLSAVSAASALLALGLLASILLRVWERPLREAERRYGRKALAADFKTADAFGRSLRVGKRYLFLLRRFGAAILPVEDVVWVYPRSRRREGGVLSWSLVLKTATGEEYSLRLEQESAVQCAIVSIQSHGYPLAVGFDKEKQRLYQKDLTTFLSRARNKTI